MLKRIMDRNSLSKDEALARINSQIDIEKKKNLAKFVIENLGSKDDLSLKIDKFLKTVSKSNN